MKRIVIRRVSAGFTLIEIMIVVGIIGLLAVAIIPNLQKTQDGVRLHLIELNLGKIHAAKGLWSLQERKGEGETPEAQDLEPFDGNPKPVVAEMYHINPLGTAPTATLTGKLAGRPGGSVIALPER